MENFLLGTAKAAVKSSDYINAISAMFEPKLFAANIDSYSFNVTEKNVDSTIEPYGDYNDYSKEDFYKNAVSSKVMTVLPPYNYDGSTIVTMSVPIIYRNTVMGVVAADIDIKDFNKIQLDTSHYSSLFTVVLDDNFQLIYDSRSSGDIVGKTLSDIAGADNASMISEKSGAAEVFSMSFKNASGKTVTSYFTPITGLISESSENQAQSIAQVTQGIDQISSVVQTNSATAEESAAASEELNSQAQLLSQLVSEFNVREEHLNTDSAENHEQTAKV